MVSGVAPTITSRAYVRDLTQCRRDSADTHSRPQRNRLTSGIVRKAARRPQERVAKAARASGSTLRRRLEEWNGTAALRQVHAVLVGIVRSGPEASLRTRRPIPNFGWKPPRRSLIGLA